jgi:aspartyl-tRNA synthetase
MIINLKNSDRDKILEMMKTYRSIRENLDLYEKDLILMEDGKKEKDDDILALLRNKIEEEIEFLKKKRGEEEKFLIYLKDTYGEGDLIIPTLEYKLKNEEP